LPKFDQRNTGFHEPTIKAIHGKLQNPGTQYFFMEQKKELYTTGKKRKNKTTTGSLATLQLP
jgi:hypothetical protein